MLHYPYQNISQMINSENYLDWIMIWLHQVVRFINSEETVPKEYLLYYSHFEYMYHYDNYMTAIHTLQLINACFSKTYT